MRAQTTGTDEVTVQVDGLGCPFCAYGLEKKFKELKGVQSVAIEIETGVMSFTYPTADHLTIAQVEQQVEKAGYTPISVSVARADGSVQTSDQPPMAGSDVSSTRTLSFFVAGNCKMCQARIEKAAQTVAGVRKASWDKQTKRATFVLSGSVMQSEIEQAIAGVGHDTQTTQAQNEVYENLPGCCHYERVK